MTRWPETGRSRIGLAALLLCIIAAPPALAGQGDNRHVEKDYVASPVALGLAGAGQTVPVGVGQVSFAIEPGETNALFTITDQVFDETEVTAVFRFGDAPIRVSVTFCRQHARDIPDGATDVTVFIQPLLDFEANTCGGSSGATTGNVHVRFRS